MGREQLGIPPKAGVAHNQCIFENLRDTCMSRLLYVLHTSGLEGPTPDSRQAEVRNWKNTDHVSSVDG